MSRNLDTRRDLYKKRAFHRRKIEREVRRNFPANQVISIRSVNAFLGSAQQVRLTYTHGDDRAMSLTKLPEQDMVDRAQEHVKRIAPTLGFGPLDTPEFFPDPRIKAIATGERVVNLQQYYRGIPVFQMELAVWMGADGAIDNVTGASVGLPKGLEVLPTVQAEQALQAAVKHLSTPSLITSARSKRAWKRVRSSYGRRLAAYNPAVLAAVRIPSQPCVLEQGGLGEAVPAHLVFFYQDEELTRLGWHLIISAPGFTEQHVVIVEADSRTADPQQPQLLYSQKTTNHLAAPKATVWRNAPRAGADREPTEFPRPKEDYPQDTLIVLPDGFPSPWINGDGRKTAGNSAIVVFQENIVDVPILPEGSELDLQPRQKKGDPQKILNAFYFCNFMHDFFLTLGFSELLKNFQIVNASGKGVGKDPVIARITNQNIAGAAQLFTRADGSQTLLDVGIHDAARRHGALDADIVFHEYTHGVTNRLVGSSLNPQPLQSPQSQAMGEGWSDYFALTIQNYYLASNQDERTVFGDWVGDNLEKGLRNCSYIDGFAGDPRGTYGALKNSLGDPHDTGRVWCAALMKMNRDLAGVLDGDKKQGHLLGWQIVIAGLQLTPANPNFIQGRDAIIHALECRRIKELILDPKFQQAYNAVWKAFAHFGMGPKAKSPSSEFSDIEEDKNEDEKNFPAPNLKET